MSEKFNNLMNYVRQLWVEERRDFDLRVNGVWSGWGQEKMARWDGGTAADGKTHKNTWVKIAQFCLDNNLNPQTLIRALFYNTKLAPQPNIAYNSTALELYRRYESPGNKLEIKNKMRYKLDSQLASAHANVVRLM